MATLMALTWPIQGGREKGKLDLSVSVEKCSSNVSNRVHSERYPMRSCISHHSPVESLWICAYATTSMSNSSLKVNVKNVFYRRWLKCKTEFDLSIINETLLDSRPKHWNVASLRLNTTSVHVIDSCMPPPSLCAGNIILSSCPSVRASCKILLARYFINRRGTFTKFAVLCICGQRWIA